MAGDEEMSARILEILRRVAESDEVLHNPNLRLYDSGLLDSLGTVNLMAALADELGVEVSPAELDRDAWATPRLLTADVLRRMAARR